MTFSPIIPTKANYQRAAVPDYGIRVHVTGRMPTGPKARGGYTAITIGRQLATTLGLSRSKEAVTIMVGSGSDAGKICISAASEGGFPGKKQVSGHYVFALGYHVTKDIFALHFEPFVIERDRVSKAQMIGGGAVIDVPLAARPDSIVDVAQGAGQ